MAKKRKETKNKGPKGKKARKAAKLDRQWGEEADEDEVKKASLRKGKSRLKSGPSRIISKPTARKPYDKAKRAQEFADDDSIVSNASGESDFGLDTGRDGETLDSLLKNINKGGSRSRRKNSEVSDEEYESDDLSSDHSDDSQNVGYDQQSNGQDQIDFDFESIRPIGEIPYLSHFSKTPLPEVNGEVSIMKDEVKKVKNKHLNENIVIQASTDIRKRFEEAESSLAMGAFGHVRKNIIKNWATINANAVRQDVDASGETKSQPVFSEVQAALIPAIANYCDMQVTCMNRENKDAIDNMLVLHVLNHVITANNHITSHNNVIRELEKKKEDVVDTDEYRDQGYTRPKVLILLPTRSTAHEFVKTMIEMLGDNSEVENEEKFQAEFGPIDVIEEANKDAEKRRIAVQKSKGKDWLELFGDEANSDDDFKLGIMMSNMKKKGKKSKEADSGVAVKFFSDFYHSDIIIASPLGLKMATNDENEEDGDIDFLSSIEVVIAHQSDVLLMQNWDHMATIMDRLNKQPKKTTGIDFARVRNYLLVAQAPVWRQTIMVSRFSDPQLISTFNRYAKSIAGKLKMRRKVSSEEASICNVLTNVRQVYQRVSCESFTTQGDQRVRYFKDTILPQLLRTKQKHTLIYIPSYFDFISVRNMMLKHEIASNHFVSVTEYARVSEVTRGRARFLQGRKRIMLYTGRAHFFMRHHIRGAKHLIMFGLPENAEFYPELLNMLSEVQSHDKEEMVDIDSSPVSCLNLFTKYEAQSLERIVGTKHSERMVKSEKKTFLFSS